jgi:hypothetical protein
MIKKKVKKPGSDTFGFNAEHILQSMEKENLNPKLIELQAAHQGMHPVILTVLAALQGLSNNEEILYEKIQP